MKKQSVMANMGDKMEELVIAVRCHVEPEEDLVETDDGEPVNIDETPVPGEDVGPENYAPRILVIDTETTIDEYQNLLVGVAMLVVGDQAAHIDGFVKKKWLIYAETTPKDKLPMMESFARKHRMEFVDRLTFIKDVLLHELTFWKGMVVGFNLPFDLSRLAVAAKTHPFGKRKEEIELIFDPADKYLPTIGIQSIDGQRAFITLHCHTHKKPYNDRITLGRGKFLDLHTLTKVLTDESMTLKQAGEHFRATTIKFEAEEHGEITEEYLEYNLNDVEATIALYRAAVEAYWKHPVKRPPHKVYSPASLGKAYLDAFGIRPLLKNQPDFPRDVLGHCMAAFYGGRAECQIRREIHPVCHVDFMSQYPSVYTLMDLQKYLIADRIEVVRDAAEEVQALLDRITIEDLFRKETWPDLMGIAALRPDADLLPVRAEYAAGQGYQIGVNYLTTDRLMWYAIPDLIAAKILTGKTPKIERAERFRAVGVQDTVRALKFMGRDDLEIDPRRDQIFKRVIEARQEFKTMKKEDGDEYDIIQHQLKIFANATSYGINVEANRVDYGGDKRLRVYGPEKSWIEERPDYDEPGRYYNPVVGVQITAAAHLLLAMAEKTALDLGGQPMMMDTDSLMIASNSDRSAFDIGREVSERFKSLLPYDLPKKGKSLLEIEDDNWARKDWTKDYDSRKLPDGTVDDNLIKGQYEPLYCYMIAAKRYCLFNLVEQPDGTKKIVIRSKSEHGLGHMLPPEKKWITRIWEWILSREMGLPCQEPEWFHWPALCGFKPNRPHTFEMFNKGTEDRPWAETIKPFNFGLRGYGSPKAYIKSPQVNRYYCPRNHAINEGECTIQPHCKFRSGCLANRTVIPIAPYAGRDEWKRWREFPWIDAHTGERIPVCRVSYELAGWRPKMTTGRVSREPGAAPGSFPFADYLMMFCGYPLHPETKYNDADGNPCDGDTRGRLTKKHIRAKEIKLISKEANTVVSLDEEEMFYDDPALFEKEVLEYGKGREPAVNPFAGMRENEWQWGDMLKKIKRLTHKEEFRRKIGVSKPYFYKLLNGSRYPSYDLMVKINDVLYSRPQDKKTLDEPRLTQKGGDILRLHDVAKACGWTDEKTLEAFRDHAIRLNREWLIDTNPPAVKEMIDSRRAEIKEEAARRKREFLADPVVNVEIWSNRTKSYHRETVRLGDITAYRIKRENRRTPRIQVKTSRGVIANVIDRSRQAAVFKLGLFPKPSAIKVDWSKAHDGKYGPWLPYPQGILLVDVMKIASNYGVSRADVMADIDAGRLFGKTVKRKKGETVLCDPWTAWKLYRDRVTGEALEKMDA